MEPSGAGIPLEERQFKSASLGRFYFTVSDYLYTSTYNFKIGFQLVSLWNSKSLFVPVAYSKLELLLNIKHEKHLPFKVPRE